MEENGGEMSQKLIVLSIDALFAEDIGYMRTLPYFGKVIRDGIYAQGGMRCIYPSLTYPAHATMITGCYPDRHGIFHNEVLDVGNPTPDWKWYRRDVKAETVLDAAKRAGLKTGCINWPTMAGAENVDYLIPEIWSEDPTADQCAILKANASEAARPIIDKYFFKWHSGDQPRLDYFMVSCAEEIIRRDQPDILFIHLSQLDHTRHPHGLYGFAVEQALTVLNENFGRLMEAADAAGNLSETNFVIVGDHGQIPVQRMFNPNIMFAEQGLIDVDESGRVRSWKVWAHSAALSCQIILKDPTDAAVREMVEAILEEMVRTPAYGVEAIFTKEECAAEYHLTGDFDYVLEGSYTSFAEDCSGSLLIEPNNENYKYSVASHGHLPHKGAQPAFIACGPAFKTGIFSRKHMVDEAPTYAAIFGLSLPDAQGKPLNEILL